MSRPTPRARSPRPATLLALEPVLDDLYRAFDRVDSATDPVQIVRRYHAPDDREVAGFIAASLAFGRVASVLASIEAVLALLGDRPARAVRAFDPRAARAGMAHLGHRWIRSDDLVALLWTMRQMIDRAGSLEGFFLAGDDGVSADVGPALDSFSSRACALDVDAAYPAHGVTRRVGYFFPQPRSGSGCKRLNLFLRWMVRRDAIDLGTWTRVSPSRLIVPLDTHVVRVGRCLRLTKYTSPGWRMAADITAALRALDPRDPVKYDFSLCHLGMMNACGFGRAQGDSRCPLRGVCRPAAGGAARRSHGPGGGSRSPA